MDAAGMLARANTRTRRCTKPPTKRNSAASASVRMRSNLTVRKPSTKVISKLSPLGQKIDHGDTEGTETARRFRVQAGNPLCTPVFPVPLWSIFFLVNDAPAHDRRPHAHLFDLRRVD